MGCRIFCVDYMGIDNSFIGFPLLFDKKQYDNNSVHKKRHKYRSKAKESIKKINQSLRVNPKESQSTIINLQ